MADINYPIANNDEFTRLKLDYATQADIRIKNEIINGDFSKGQEGWDTSGYYFNEFEVVDGVAVTTNFTQNNRGFIQSIDIDEGDIIYCKFDTKVDNIEKLDYFRVQGMTNGQGNSRVDITSEMSTYSTTIKALTDITRIRFYYRFKEVGEYRAYLDNVILVNLTKLYGKGNEPTKEEFDSEILKFSSGYFEGEVALPQSELRNDILNKTVSKERYLLEIGNIDDLKTLNKTNLVSAINEISEGKKYSGVKIIDKFPVNHKQWDIETKPYIIFNDRSKWGAGDFVTLDEETTFMGEATLRFELQEGDRKNFRSSGVLDIDVDLAEYDYLDLWVKLDRRFVSTTDSLTLLLGSDGLEEENSIGFTTPMTYIPSGNFEKVRVPLYGRTVKIPWNTINKARFHMVSGEKLTMHLARIDAVKVDKAQVSITFDDASPSVNEIAYPIMRKYNIPGTFYVNPNAVTESQWNDFRKMRDEGWVIGSHTQGHVRLNGTDTTDEEKVLSILRADAILKREGFHIGARFLAYPWGAAPVRDSIVEEVVRKTFIASRRVNTTVTYHSPVGFYQADNILGVNMGYTNDANYGIDLIQEAMNGKLLVTFLFHNINDNPQNDSSFHVDEFETLMQHIADLRDTGKINVVTPADLYLQHTGNVIKIEGSDYIDTKSVDGNPLLLKLPSSK